MGTASVSQVGQSSIIMDGSSFEMTNTTCRHKENYPSVFIIYGQKRRIGSRRTLSSFAAR